MNLPPMLLDLARYLPWVIRARPNGGAGKCPVRRLGHRLYPVRPDTPGAWLTLTDALREVRTGGASGVGLCLPPGLVVLDLDGVVTAGRLETAVQRRLSAQPSYAEYSPSGNGIHIWYGCNPEAQLQPRRGDGWDLLTPGTFVTVTGAHIPGVTLCLNRLPAALLATATGPRPRVQQAAPYPVQPPRDDRIEAALNRSAKLRRLYVQGDISSYRSASEADLALCQLLHRLVGPDPEEINRLFRQSALWRLKWEESTYRTRTLRLTLSSGRP